MSLNDIRSMWYQFLFWFAVGAMITVCTMVRVSVEPHWPLVWLLGVGVLICTFSPLRLIGYYTQKAYDRENERRETEDAQLPEVLLEQAMVALKPFAAMDRSGDVDENSNDDEEVARRGTGASATCIFSGDFRRAKKALDGLAAYMFSSAPYVPHDQLRMGQAAGDLLDAIDKWAAIEGGLPEFLQSSYETVHHLVVGAPAPVHPVIDYSHVLYQREDGTPTNDSSAPVVIPSTRDRGLEIVIKGQRKSGKTVLAAQLHRSLTSLGYDVTAIDAEGFEDWRVIPDSALDLKRQNKILITQRNMPINAEGVVGSGA